MTSLVGLDSEYGFCWLAFDGFVDVVPENDSSSFTISQYLAPWQVSHWFRRVFIRFVSVPAYSEYSFAFLGISMPSAFVGLVGDDGIYHELLCFFFAFLFLVLG